MTAILAEVTRGSIVESVHHGAVAVADGAGRLVASVGDSEQRLFFRSSAKPFQAVPMITTGAADRFGFTTEELALACASHTSTEQHQEVVRSMLRKAGVEEQDMRCGISPPLDDVEKARVTLGIVEPDQVTCECSGEHAGMLAACRAANWSIEEYVAPDHPLQRDIKAAVAAACGLPEGELTLGTDGCSIPTFGAPLRAFAFAYAVLADPTGAIWTGSADQRAALDRLRASMVAHPVLIDGEDELDTDIIRLTEGRVVAKLGAEGLLCLAVPDRGLGIAISDASGSQRGLGPAAVAVLEQLELLSGNPLAGLRERHSGAVTSFTGEPVGEIRPVLQLGFS